MYVKILKALAAQNKVKIDLRRFPFTKSNSFLITIWENGLVFVNLISMGKLGDGKDVLPLQFEVFQTM